MIGPDVEPASLIAASPAYPPVACTCPHAQLARALDAILGMSPDELGTVMALVESQRVGAGSALAAALKAEAVHLAGLAHRAHAAADRLVTRSSPND